MIGCNMTTHADKLEMIERIRESNAFVGLAFSFEDIGFISHCLDMCIEGTKDVPEWQGNIKRIAEYIKDQTLNVMNDESIAIQYSDLLDKMSAKIIQDEFSS